MTVARILATIAFVCCIFLNKADEEQKTVYFQTPTVPDNAYIALYFEPGDLGKRVILSKAKKANTEDSLAQYEGLWSLAVPDNSAVEGDHALIMMSKAKHHGLSFKLDRPLKFDTKDVVIQYEVKYQNGMECGGSYIKLLSDIAGTEKDLSKFQDKTPFTIMFGPDKCGNEQKLHFIFRHKNPVTGEYEEKALTNPKKDLDSIFNDKMTHLLTLVMHDDNTFEIYVDQVLAKSGNLLTDFTPSVNPQKEIFDSADKKPSDWDDRRKIADPDAKKPEDWDESLPEFVEDTSVTKPAGWLDNEPLMISDLTATRPDDWDKDIDGDWEAPMIDNPKCKDAAGCGKWEVPRVKNPLYKGVWTAPMIENPNYKGIWEPRKIPNPNYFEDEHPYRLTDVFAIGIELWTMTEGVVFDNFLIVDSKDAADKFASETWVVKHVAEVKANPNSQSVVDYVSGAYKERPWLVILIVLAIVLPVVLVFYCLCRSSPSDESARAKKDDDYLAAGDSNLAEDKQRYSPAGPASKSKSPATPASSNDDEGEEEEEAAEGEETEEEAGLEANAQSKENATASTPQTNSARRRNVRKD